MREFLTGLESEVARRMVHVSGSLLPLGYVFVPDVVTWQVVRLIVGVALAVSLVLEVIRLGLGLDWWIYDHLTRSYEQDNLAGYALAMISAGIVVFAVDPTVAVPALLMLTLGDPISGLLGSGDASVLEDPGSFEVIRKPAAVLGVMFAVCTAIALPFVHPVAAALGGFAAMVADGLKPVVASFVLDDNFTIPLVGAGAMSLGLLVV